MPHFGWLPEAPRGSGGGDERWLITYADMITLLLVLFIILYSMANTDLEKFQAMAESLREGFGATAPGAAEGIQGPGGSPIFDTSGGGESPLTLFPENQTPISIFEFQQMLAGLTEGGRAAGEGGELAQAIEAIVEQAMAEARRAGIDIGDLPAGVDVEFNERGIRIIAYPTQLWFESGSARLLPAGHAFLEALAGPLKRLTNRIEVQGHTDSVPINTVVYPSNWELSAGRAGSVIRYLEQLGLPPERMQAAGYADTMPVASNDTRQGRARNRRVEILVLREEYETFAPRMGGAGPAEPPATPTDEQPPAEGAADAGAVVPAEETDSAAAEQQP
jgi:chemotaxis protein MotB